MQIHELTLKKSQQVDEGIASDIGGAVGKGIGAVKKAGTAIASPFRDVAAGYRSGKVDAKTNSIANKAYRAWSAYRQQLDKAAPGGKASASQVEQQLLAFVQKNLLGQKQFSSLINRDQISKVVKQIAAEPVQTGGAGAFGQMAQQLGKGTEVGAQATSSTGGTVTQTDTGKVHQAKQAPVATPAKGVRAGKVPSASGKMPKVSPAPKAGGPTPAEQAKFQQMIQQATKGAVKEAVDPSQELELFKKLVTLAAQAETKVDTKATSPTSPTNTVVKSTGNTEADQLLAKSGFKVQA